MFGSALCGAYTAVLAQQCAQQQAKDKAMRQNLNLYNAMGIENLTKAQAYLAYAPTSKPCQYCGRTNQKHGHASCDGCGAPR